MRQQLIGFLIDDIAPRVRRSGDPEGELLKFASEKNLSPALLEGLGQLFNTAKTLCYMEKNSSQRGATFPTVDVQNLVSQYLEVPAKKMTKDAGGWLEADDKLAPGARMPDFFSLPENDGLEFSLPKSASFRKQSLSPLRANINTAELVKTDMEESARGLLDRMVKKARRSQLDWNTLELDALAVIGEEAKPALDNAASYLAAHNIKVARQQYDGKPRFVESDLVEIELLSKALVSIKEATVMVDEMRAELKKSSSALAKGEVDEEEEEDSKSPKPVAPNNSGRGSAGKDLGGSPFEFLPKGGDSSKSVFKTAPDAMFNLLAPARDHFFKGVMGHLGSPDNSHAAVESALGDSQHLALLQNLMTTDDVLSEADPDQVVSAFNTIRQTAPHLAKDVNVMRVALRSAVQHEGIDPFTIKGIAETETARQKAVSNTSPAKPKDSKE